MDWPTPEIRAFDAKELSSGLAPALTKGRRRRQLADSRHLDLFPPPTDCPAERQPGGAVLGGSDRRFGWSAKETVEGKHTPTARPNNAPAAWFEQVKADRRLTLAAVSIARLMQDQRPRSLVEYASETGLSLRVVPKAIRRLEAAGHVRVIRSRGGPGRKNRFVLVHTGGAQ